MLSKLFFVLLALNTTAAVAKSPPKKQHVHDHGHAKLAVAAEGDQIALDLEVPGDSVFGFEHAPKTDAEKKIYAAALDDLKTKPLELFLLSKDLGCVVQEAKAEAHNEGNHSDVDAAYKFKCAKPLAGAKLTLALLDRFPRLKEVKVQLTSGATQAAKTVTKSADALDL